MKLLISSEPALTEYLEVYRPRFNAIDKTDWEQPEHEWLYERRKINDSQVEAWYALYDLKEKLEQNPYPGQQKRLLALAATLFPDFRMGFHVSCRASWEAAFRELGEGELDPLTQVSFPVLPTKELSIEEVEAALLQQVTAAGYVPASALLTTLGVGARSATYRITKAALEDRGWSWSTRRSQRTTIKVITPPS